VGCWQLKNLRKRRRTEEEELMNEEVKKQKKIDFAFGRRKRRRRRNYAKNKQTPLGSVAFREHTQSIHSIDFSNPWEVLEREFSSISENSCSHLAEEVREKERD